METVHIYHTNDLHSHFEHWPKIRRLLAERKKWHIEAGDDVFLFDIGDHVDRWHPFTEGTMGKGNTRLLNESGYTAVTIGNNEGITLTYEDLDSLYQDARFDVITANLYNEDGSRPEWANPSQIYQTKKGTRIGVIGLTAAFSHFYELLGWKLHDPLAELKEQLHQIRGKADVIILLSHLGINEDERIAEIHPEIDVILGGHTHHILHEGKKINGSLLAAAGKHGNYAGHVVLSIDNHKITEKKAWLYEIGEQLPLPEDDSEALQLWKEGKEKLDEKVVYLKEMLSSDYFTDSDLPLMLCETLREWCDADCAFLNAGLLLGSLHGEVSKYDLLTVCPHPINPCLVELSGSELKEVLRQTLDESLHHLQITGIGFRGKIMGKFVYDRISYDRKGLVFYINGEKINLHKKYSVAIPDMFTFGRFFPEIVRAKNKKYFLPELLRDLLEWKLKQS